MEPTQTEYNKVRQVARQYEKNGYKVVIKPQRNDIPSFIKNYEPDIIAKSESDNVVIEIKRRADFATIEKLRETADIINKRANWRFELIVISGSEESSEQRRKSTQELGQDDITNNLSTVHEMLQKGYLDSAFLLLWGTFESIARQLLLIDNKNLNNKTPLVLIKTLFSFGYLTRTDLDNLENLFGTRNQIVHGYKATNFDKKNIDKLIAIVKKLEKEYDNLLNSTK